jgi:DNA polymerase-3 subunit delta'
VTGLAGDVFGAVVGQPDAVATLRRAVDAAARIVASTDVSGADRYRATGAVPAAATGGASGEGTGRGSGNGAEAGVPGAAMTHAWLFTGPPGSGRSVAARAFAAALQCARGGCGGCAACHTALAGTHADVRFVVPEGLTIGVQEMRALVLRAQGAPSRGRWQILMSEDADRLTEQAGNALLKAIEEPPARTVFLLCTPSTHPDDVSVTIRSRCRVVPLRQPSPEAVAQVLAERDGVEPATARWAAAAAQGHVGRARRLATDPQARATRDAVLAIPRRLTGLAACFDAAGDVITAAEREAAAVTADLSEKERDELSTALGAGGTGKGAAAAQRGIAGQLKDLERRQKTRATRAQRDALDRALTDLAGFYRDVLAARLAAPVPPIHADATDTAGAAAARWTPTETLRRVEAVLACREAIAANVKPRIAVESMMLTLWRG